MANVRHARMGEFDPERDKPAVYAWLRSHLRWHLDVWSRAAGLGWGQAEINAHIDAHELVESEWNELTSAAGDPEQLVSVARVSRRPVGIIHAREHHERYLRIPVGVLQWIFVEPVSRGSGVSRLLMDASREWMRRRGLRAAEVFVTAGNRAAVTVYRRGGYQLIDHRMLARLDDDL